MCKNFRQPLPRTKIKKRNYFLQRIIRFISHAYEYSAMKIKWREKLNPAKYFTSENFLIYVWYNSEHAPQSLSNIPFFADFKQDLKTTGHWQPCYTQNDSSHYQCFFSSSNQQNSYNPTTLWAWNIHLWYFSCYFLCMTTKLRRPMNVAGHSKQLLHNQGCRSMGTKWGMTYKQLSRIP